MPTGSAYVFGPFHFDPVTPQLRGHGTLVVLTLQQLRLLGALLARAGELITKNELIEVAWQGIIVADNTLSKSIATLREELEKHPPYTILNQHGHGYRFIGPVERLAGMPRHVDLEALLAPYRAFVEGRAALETLKRDRIDAARQLFTGLVTEHPSNAMMHVGLANASVLTFEATRAQAAPAVDALQTAAIHARDACHLDPDYAEGFATLGFVLERTGDRATAIAALTRAVDLDAQNWRHHLRLSYGSWGEQRLAAARRTLTLLPGCPMAHLLAATVFVARGGLVQAEREVDVGLEALPSPGAAELFSAVGLHWLKGLLLLARGRDDEARAAFGRELAMEASGHLYARECSANAWYAIGVCDLRRGDLDGACAALSEATTRAPRHAMAHAGLALIRREAMTGGLAQSPVDAAFASAVQRVADERARDAAQLVDAALRAAPAGNSGWLLPIEPLLRVQRDPAAWAPVLAMLCARAT